MLVFLLSSPLPIAKHYRAKKEETKKIGFNIIM